MSEMIAYVSPESLLLAEGAQTETPEQRADEINSIKAMARNATTTYAIAIGQRLLEVRTQISAGSWMAWLRDNVDYSLRTAENLMAIAERFRGERRKLVEGVNVTTAVLLLGATDDEIATLVEEKPLEDYATRELKAALEEMRAKCEKQQLTIDELMAAAKPDPIEKNQVTMLQDAEDRHRAEMEKARADMDEAVKMRDAATSDATRNAEERREAERQRDAAKREAERLTGMLEKTNDAMADLEKRLKAAESRTADVPEEVQKELDELRARIAAGSNKQETDAKLAAFKAGYAITQQGWQAMMEAVGTMDQEARSRARLAISRLVTVMEKQVEAL